MTKHTRNFAVAMFMASFVVLSGCVSDGVLGKAATGRGELSTDSQQSAEQRRIDIRMQLAVGYYGQKQYEVALDEVAQVVKLAPSYANAYGMRGLIYMEMGEMALAESNFQRALKLSPGNPDFSNNYGLLLCRSDRASQSIAYFEAALKNRAYRTPSVAASNAGVCSLKSNNALAAQQFFLQSLQYEPNAPLANVYLAKWYADQKDIERARFHIGFVERQSVLSAEVLWLAIKVERQLGNKAAEDGLATQLRQRYPESSEYTAYQRGVFDE